MKGQLPIQNVVVILISIIVAVVIIRLFLNRMGGTSLSKTDDIKNLKFQEQCESLCQEYKKTNRISELEKFCSAKMTQTDLNKNGKIDSIKATTKILDICEDAVYCFHLYPCDIGSKTLEWADCRKAVCDYYTESYSGDSNKADLKVFELFPGVGKCEIPKEENWWEIYFGEKPCTEPPTELYLKDCFYDKVRDELICKTNCDLKRTQEIIFIVTDEDLNPLSKASLKADGNGIGSIQLDKKMVKVKTSDSLSSLDPDTGKWSVILICEPFGNYLINGVSSS